MLTVCIRPVKDFETLNYQDMKILNRITNLRNPLKPLLVLCGVSHSFISCGKRSYLFDFAWYFRLMDYLRIGLKKFLLTKLRLRDKQSCRYCGRDQHIIWSCKDEDWVKIPKRWHNTALCLECFINLYPEKLNPEDIEIMGYDCGYENCR